MNNQTFEEIPVKLMCGCMIGDFGKICQECLPHSQGNFMK